jgi:O-antigen/teichoic acid export membrane protein
MGAAIGTLTSDVACFSIMFYLTRKHVTSFNFGFIMIKPALAAVAAAIILWFVKVWPFYLSAVIFGASYIFFIWVFRVTSTDQLIAIREMAGGLMKKFGQSRRDTNGSEDTG